MTFCAGDAPAFLQTAVAIAEGLRGDTYFNVVELADSYIGDVGCTALCGALSVCLGPTIVSVREILLLSVAFVLLLVLFCASGFHCFFALELWFACPLLVVATKTAFAW